MSISFQKNLKRFETKEACGLFRGIKRGFEKESLRVDMNGQLAKTAHPKVLGSNLTHPFITTDYSEALLEFITPPTKDLNEPFLGLTELHAFTYRVLQDEMLWTASMPCNLPKDEDIPIAEYGNSNLGQLKHIYRRGLGKRYGRSMQMIAGIHYNFSLSEHFFQNLYHAQYANLGNKAKPLLKDFISEQYLAMIRNSLRWGFILPLLFGATPAICSSLFNPKAKIADKLESLTKNTVYGPFATSLRLSDLGYQNKADSSNIISYNSFPEFIQTMHDAVHTIDPKFTKIPLKIGEEYQQLNDSILQTEDEHYAMVRPKRVSLPEERTLSALMRDGIEYIELRALDIHPMHPLGIEPRTAFILDAFLITCLFLESPVIDNEENNRIQNNLYRVVTEGRNPDLKIINNMGKEEPLLEATENFLNLMYKTAEILDKGYGINNFGLACRSAINSLKDLNNLPSARIIQEIKIKQWSYFDFVKYWSIHHRNYFKSLHFPVKLVQYYELLAKESLERQAELERNTILPFSEFLVQFLAP